MVPDVRATTDITAVVGNYYDKLMLERLVSATVLYPMIEKRPIPKGGGKVINMNRYTNFPVAKALVPLTEGEVPTQTYLSGTAVTMTLGQYGDWTATSDLLDMTSFSDVVAETTKNFADQAAITVDSIIYLRMLADTTFDESPASAQTISTWFYGLQGGFSSIYLSADGLVISSFAVLYSTLSAVDAGDGHTLDLSKVSQMASKLRSNNCKPYADGYYKLYTHPKCVDTIRRTAEWATWNAYTRPEVLAKGQVGMAHGVKIYESTIPVDVVARTSAPWAANISGVWNVIWGKGGVAVTDIGGSSKPEIIVKTANKADTSNPLNQWNTIGWKVTMAAKVLNKNCGYAFLTLVN
jgi:N4-gp56 family major capsid protein